MLTKSISSFHAARWVYLFIILHLFLWTIVPLLVRYNLPLDAIEGAAWGHQLEWGYDKNPFLNGWLTAFAVHLGGSSGWMIYLFSQFSVAICFWAVWQLAKEILQNNSAALISVFILEAIQYFNFHAIDFNDNTLELSLWTITSYCFYSALKKNKKIIAWILTGTFAGLALMAKYYTAALLAAMMLFLLHLPQNRKQLTTLPPYLGLIAFLSMILPHAIWLFSHDFITIHYVFERTEAAPSWFNHIYFPAQFAWQQLEVFLPALLIFALFFLRPSSFGRKPAENTSLSSFDKTFLFYIALGPFLLTIFLSILLGIKLRAGWGMPLQSLWGILLAAALKPHLTDYKLKYFLLTIFIFMGTLLTGYSISLIYSSDPTSGNFPGREIANEITREWRQRYHTPLTYVAGPRWIGGNIQFYSPDHPAVFMEWDKRRSPWINLEDLKQKGAVFVWDVFKDKIIPLDIQKQFPELENVTLLETNWHRDHHHKLPPIKIGMAMLPPRK